MRKLSSLNWLVHFLLRFCWLSSVGKILCDNTMEDICVCSGHIRWHISHFYTKRRTNLLTVWSTYVNVRWSRFVLLGFFILFFAFFPSATLTFQEFIASFDSSLTTWRANYPFVHLNVNLGRTLDDFFVWTNKSWSKNGLHRQTNSGDSVIRKFVRLIFNIRWFVCPDDLFVF